MRNFLTIIFSCLFLSTFAAPVLAGQVGSKKSEPDKKINYASLVESEIHKLAEKSNIFFAEKKINTLKDRYAYFHVLASIIRAVHEASVHVDANPDYLAAFEAFNSVANSTGVAPYFETWNRILNDAYLTAKKLATDAAAKAYKKAIKKGASESEAKELSNHVATLKMLDYFNSTFQFEDAYADALANFPEPLDYFRGVWTPSTEYEFVNLPEGAQVFLPLLEAFDPEVISFSDQAVTFMSGYGDQGSVVNALPVEVLGLIVLSLASVQNQMNSH